jgi:hypothetical protein
MSGASEAEANGDPLKNLGLFQDEGGHLSLIMKHGRVHKNVLSKTEYHPQTLYRIDSIVLSQIHRISVPADVPTGNQHLPRCMTPLRLSGRFLIDQECVFTL